MRRFDTTAVVLTAGAALLAVVGVRAMIERYVPSSSCVVAGAPCVKSISELLSDPERYDGSTISIRGEFGTPFEGSYVRDDTSQTSLWLDLRRYTGAESNLDNLCGFSGILSGTFRQGPAGHLGMSDGELLVRNITELNSGHVFSCGLRGNSQEPPMPTYDESE
jgi:hypothetical protein